LETIEREIREKEYDQMIVVTIFLSNNLSENEIKDFAVLL